MAEEQSQTTAAEETAEERDLSDQLIDDLNDGVSRITFDRDVLDTNRPDDWGAVELSGDSTEEWADGHLVDQELIADVWVCVNDRGSGVKRRVQKVLKEYGESYGAGWIFVRRAYLYDLDKVLWQWRVSINGPLAEEEEELPFTDPEEDPEEETDPEWPEIDQGGDD